MILYKLFLTGVFLFIGTVIISMSVVMMEYNEYATRADKIKAVLFAVGGVVMIGLSAIFWL